MSNLWRMMGISLFVATAVSGCASSSEGRDSVAEPAVSSTSTTVTPTTSSTTSTTTTSTTTTSTTTTIPEELPLRIDDAELIRVESHAQAFKNGPIEVRVESRTGPVKDGGLLNGGERVFIVNYWDGELMVGSASFAGPSGISARANRNRDLAASLLIFGSSYSFDGEWLVGERRLFSTVSEQIVATGSEWVKIRVDDLDEQQHFALRLLAPFTSGQPIESSDADADITEELLLLERRGDWSVYRHEVRAPDSSSVGEVIVDGDGRLSEWSTQSDNFGGSEFRGVIRPLDELPIGSIDPFLADDVTAAFAAYASARFETNPGSLNG